MMKMKMVYPMKISVDPCCSRAQNKARYRSTTTSCKSTK
jgi:hypothetical protein